MVISSQDENNLKTIINEILKHKYSNYFAEPVDVSGLGLFDYNDIIKKPMDLSTIRKNLESKTYSKPEEALDDIQLIWDNCKIYNREDSFIYDAAEKIEKLADKTIKKYYKKYIKKINIISSIQK